MIMMMRNKGRTKKDKNWFTMLIFNHCLFVLLFVLLAFLFISSINIERHNKHKILGITLSFEEEKEIIRREETMKTLLLFILRTNRYAS